MSLTKINSVQSKDMFAKQFVFDPNICRSDKRCSNLKACLPDNLFFTTRQVCQTSVLQPKNISQVCPTICVWPKYMFVGQTGIDQMNVCRTNGLRTKVNFTWQVVFNQKMYLPDKCFLTKSYVCRPNYFWPNICLLDNWSLTKSHLSLTNSL